MVVNGLNLLSVGQDGSDPLSMILNLVWLGSFVLFMFYGQKIQTWNMLREIGGAVNRLKVMRDEARQVTIDTVKELGNVGVDPSPRIDNLLELFSIMPMGLDPAGIVPKLERVIDVRKQRYEDEVKIVAPSANKVQIANLEGVFDFAIGLNDIYRVVRHFYLLGRKTMSLYVIMQVQMQLPIIMQLAEAVSGSVIAFSKGQPIGDGAGPLVAAKMMRGTESRLIAEDIVASELVVDGRKVLVMKAEGPGGNVGKVGDGVKKLIEENKGKVAMIVMVDAGAKYEGEETGDTSEGTGAAIGGPGVDQYKIEEETLKYKIPIQAIKIKESLHEALTPMKKKIVDGTDVAVAKVKRLIKEQTSEGDVVIVVGVGNTLGVGQ
jgi:hypothetical protein